MPITLLPPAPTRDDPTNFAEKADALLAALGPFVDEANQLEQNTQRTAVIGTSNTELTISAGIKVLAAEPGKAWIAGGWLYLISAAAVGNAMVCQVSSYDPDTGALSVNVASFAGAGTFSNWMIGLATPQVPLTTPMLAPESVTMDKLARGARYDPGQWVLSMSATPPKWTLVPDGRTIGNAVSGATSRANADTFDLYKVLWEGVSNAYLAIQNADGVPTARGASAEMDFAANKRMPLPVALDGDALLAAVTSAVGARTAGQVIAHGHGATVHAGGYHSHLIGIGTSEGNDAGTATNGTGRNAEMWADAGGEHNHGITIDDTGGARNLATGLYTRLYIAM